jgi:hypothetical protein
VLRLLRLRAIQWLVAGTSGGYLRYLLKQAIQAWLHVKRRNIAPTSQRKQTPEVYSTLYIPIPCIDLDRLSRPADNPGQNDINAHLTQVHGGSLGGGHTGSGLDLQVRLDFGGQGGRWRCPCLREWRARVVAPTI